MNDVSKCYREIRGYIQITAEENYSVIDGYVANSLNLSEKTIRNIVNGKRTLKKGEDILMAQCVIENYYLNNKCDKVQLKKLLKALLHTADPAASLTDIDKTICSMTGEKYCEGSLSTDSVPSEAHNKAPLKLNSQFDENSTKIFSNVPNGKTSTQIIRTKSLNDISEAIDSGKIVFLDGMIGMGKKYVASSYILQCKNEGRNRYTGYIWNQKRTNESFTFNDLIRNILITFGKNTVTNVNTDVKVEEAILQLKKHRSLIVIEDFHAVDDLEQDKILDFLLNEFDGEELSAILISNQRLDSLENIYARYTKLHEIRIKRMTVEENFMYCDVIAQNKETVQKAKLIYDDIFSFVYKVCGGHPFATDIVLNSMAHSLVRGVDVEELKKKYSTFKVKGIGADNSYGFLTELVSNIFAEMPEDARKVLLALCLLEAPANVNELYAITGIDGLTERGTLKDDSRLSNAIECCLKNSFVESVIVSRTVRFEIAPFLRRVVPKETSNISHEEFLEEITAWLDYIRAFSHDKMGFKFDEFKKLKYMDNNDGIYLFSNVASALNYCWDRGLWSYYYDISYQSRYYLYTRGCSGRDRESIHYKRAYAARMLNDPEKEMEALLYHTNVCCKIGEIDTVEECFARIEKLMEDSQKSKDIRKMYTAKYIYTKALYASAKKKYDDAICLYNEYEDILKELFNDISGDASSIRKFKHDYIASLRWHSYCLYKKACDTGCDISQALIFLDEAIEMAKSLNFTRAIVHATIVKVKIILDIEKDKDKAKCEFEKLNDYIVDVENDYLYNKDYKFLGKKLIEL